MAEINLMDRYPESKRSQKMSLLGAGQVSDESLAVMRRFGEEYFESTAAPGYGGYRYDPRFWRETVKRLRDYYGLAPDAEVLEVGCAKGFLMRDFIELMPHIRIRGVDVSEYAIANADPIAKPFVQNAIADNLPFPNESFDLVLAIKVLHLLPLERCMAAVREIQRVSRKNAFIVVNAWRKDEERELQMQLSPAAVTILQVDDWVAKFKEVGYTGDYWWDIHE